MHRAVWIIVSAFALSGCGEPPRPIAPATTAQFEFPYAATGATYPYLVYTPATWTPDRHLPALLLIHGAGGNGAGMIALWRSFANAHGIVLVAPTFPLDAVFETHVPELYAALMDTVRRMVQFDPTRVYAFGYSAGGYTVYDVATLASTRFAAVGVFGMIISPDYYGIIAQAKRKTPIAIYIGDHDRFWTLAQMRTTRDTLLGAAFPVHYVEMPDQDHNYATASAFVNADLWAFMSAVTLPSETP